MTKKYLITISDEMASKLTKEMNRRMLETLPETIRVILSEHLTNKR